MEIRRNHLLQDPSTIWRSQEGKSCLKISYKLKTIKVFGTFSATSSTRDLQKKISARSWMRTNQDRSNSFTNAAIRATNSRTGRIGRGKAGVRGSENNHLQTNAGREAQYFDGIKKLAAKFNRATVLVLKGWVRRPIFYKTAISVSVFFSLLFVVSRVRRAMFCRLFHQSEISESKIFFFVALFGESATNFQDVTTFLISNIW